MLGCTSNDTGTEFDQRRRAMRRSLAVVLLGASLAVAPARAQEPVVGAPDAEALFTSADPRLHRNKQAAYHIQKDLLEAGHWELADQWLTERYLQHNPNAKSGRAGAVKKPAGRQLVPGGCGGGFCAPATRAAIEAMTSEWISVFLRMMSPCDE
jgi:hypothetical protein